MDSRVKEVAFGSATTTGNGREVIRIVRRGARSSLSLQSCEVVGRREEGERKES